jgi:excisionase family DNA binding protein
MAKIDFMGTTAAAKALGVSGGRVRQLILAGRLKAEKIGPAWLILVRDLEAVRDRPPGRPWHKKGKVRHNENV